jgi:hypothetical protein
MNCALMSTWPPKPPGPAEPSSWPLIVRPVVADSTSRPASLGVYGAARLLRLAYWGKKVLALVSAYCEYLVQVEAGCTMNWLICDWREPSSPLAK